MRRLITLLLAAVVLSSVASTVPAAEPDYGFKFGGYFKTDAIYDNARISPGDYRIYVPAYGEEKNNEFYLSIKETRLAFDFWWDEEDFKTTAKLEFDLYGLSAAHNKAQMMVRHAYVRMTGENWAFLAGQTWDIISPLNPGTVNYSVLWGQGNIGYRRPQLRFTASAVPAEKTSLRFDAGVTRNIGLDLDDDGINDGADAGFPTLQGRLGLDAPLLDAGKIGIGVSGHYGSSTWGPEDSLSVDSWSANVDLIVQPTAKFALLGEFFTGENLGQYLGGALQSVNPVGDPLPSMGGWGMVRIIPTGRVILNFGYGFDDPDDEEWIVPDDGEAYTLRDMNSEFFGNLMYGITDNVQAMFEIAWMNTEYLTRTFGGDPLTDEFDALRFQVAVKAAIR